MKNCSPYTTPRVVFGLLVLVLVLSACAPQAAPTTAPAAPAPTQAPPTAAPVPTETKPAAELKIALTALPVSLDPAQDGGLIALATYSLLYDRLIEIDENGKPQPGLATSWKPISDTVWEFKLREGVKFHNGEPFTASTAKFVIERAMTAKESRYANTLAAVNSVTAVDPTTLHIETKQPWAFLPSRLAVIWMYPEKYFQEKGVEEYAKAPVGTGKYRFVEWQQDNFMVLDRNEEYWGAKPDIARLHLRHMPDPTNRVNAIESGEVNVAYIIDPEQAARLQQAGFQVINKPIGQGFSYFIRTGEDSPLKDPKVREALSYAVDTATINDALFAGQAAILQGQPVGTDADGFNANLKPYPYDPDKARQMLADAGYPDGFQLDLDTTSGTAPKDKEVAEAIADQLSEVGVTLNIILNERGVYLDKLFNAKMAPLWSLSLNYAPSFTLENPLLNFTCRTGHKSHCDPEYDKLHDQWSATFDEAERIKLSDEALQYIHDQALALFLWQVPGIYVVEPTVQGLKLRGDYTMDLSQVTVAAQ